MAHQVSLRRRDPNIDTRHTETSRHTSPLAFHKPTRPDGAGEAKDYFIEEDGCVFAGRHLLLDLWDAHNLDDRALIETALREAVDACGATLLHIHLHEFTPNGGISGVAVLAESHISVHTWPERGFAAFDVFMCGACRPYAAVAVLERHFRPGAVTVDEQRRGVVR